MRAAGVTGETIPWRDVLHEGPVNASLPLDELSEQRAGFIAERGWGEFEYVRRQFAERNRAITERAEKDEVVLWFEDDLYDQLQLLQLLHFFSSRRGQKLSLVQVDGHIPPLSLPAIREHQGKRAPVSGAQLELGAHAWIAFGSSDPMAMARILTEDTSALRYLAPALVRLMQEYPAVEHGLSRVESGTLTAVEAGHATPVSAFMEVARKEESIFLGDTIFYCYLERLSAGERPLVTWMDGARFVAPNPMDPGTFHPGELVITDVGRDVLAGRLDWQRINTTARWIGGVEIKPGEGGWRWDRSGRALVQVTSGPGGKGAGKSGIAKKGPRGGPR